MPPKDLILHCALELYEAEGLEALSMRKVAERAGFSPMGLYRHFQDKAALVEALLEVGFAEARAGLLACRRARTPLRRLWKMLDRTLEFALERPRLFELMFMVPGLPVRQFPWRAGLGTSPTLPLFQAEVEACMAARLFRRDDPAEVTLTLWAQAHGFISLHFMGRLDRDPVLLRHRYRQCLRRLFRGLLQPAAP